LQKSNSESEPHKIVFIKELPKNTMDEAIDYILYLHNKFKFKKIVCDSTGLGAGVVDVLAKKLNTPSKISQTTYRTAPNSSDIVIGVTFTAKNKQDIYSYMKLLMEQGMLKFPNHKKLLYQLRDFRYEKMDSGNLKLHHSEGGFDDIPDAIACACHGIRSDNIGGDYFFM